MVELDFAFEFLEYYPRIFMRIHHRSECSVCIANPIRPVVRILSAMGLNLDYKEKV